MFSVSLIGFTPLKGDVGPTVLAGRAPRTAHEVALGTTTLDEIGASIGDRVRIAGPGGDDHFRIVGRIAMPLFETEDVQRGLKSAVDALTAGRPRPTLDFKGR